MKKNMIKTRCVIALKSVCVLLVCLLVFAFPFYTKTQNGVGRYAITASAYTDDPSIAIHKYDLDLTVGTDRKVAVKERITVEFLKRGLTMFYRSLPKEGARYYDIKASCDNNDAFSYVVEDNPDYDEFIDINCIGNAQKGQTWVYDITYIMEPNMGNTGDTMIMDVVGFGWPVVLNDVSVTVHLPASITADDYKVKVGYNSKEDSDEVQKTLSEDGATLTMYAEKLVLEYIDDYEEKMAKGVTLLVDFPENILTPYAKTDIFTGRMGVIVTVGIVVLAASCVALILTKKKREIITTVNVTAPDKMDPMKMGKWIDGSIDNEDVTSMIYYFAHKGYLIINLEDENDPVLIRKVRQLPDNAPIYEKTLFNGLFKSNEDSVPTSKLAHKFYETAAIAKQQLPSPKMFEKKSFFGFISGGLIGVLFMLLLPLVYSMTQIGAGYGYGTGLIIAGPIGAILFVAYFKECNRYKWKPSGLLGATLIQLLVAVLTTVLCVCFFGLHVFSRYETAALCLFAFGAVFLTIPALSRKERYADELGQILGFKEFILYTEEDKLKFMLEENPELYYKVLPYAQVLGVTKEWEEKFEKIMIEPPSWCVGSRMDIFDYMLLRHCMTRAMVTAMTPPANQSTVGRSGGGGHFGGFGGGGFGGGGGGAR